MSTKNMVCEADQHEARRAEMQPGAAETSFSANASIYNIILAYLHPFELACVTGMHTADTYNNAAACGSLEYLAKYRSEDTDFNDALCEAARSGQLDSAQQLIKFGATNSDEALCWAAKAGRLNYIQLFMTYDPDTDSAALCSAIYAGRMDCARQLIDFYTKAINVLSHKPEYINQPDYFLYQKTVLFDTALRVAVEAGQIDCIRLLVENGATDLNMALSYAAYAGHIECIRLLVVLGAYDINEAFINAAYGGRTECIRLLVVLGATHFNEALCCATKYSRLDCIRQLVEFGATDFNGAILHAQKYNQSEAVALLTILSKK